MYWFSLLAGSASTGQQEKERRQAVPRAGRIVTKRLLTRFDYMYYKRGLSVSVPHDRSARDDDLLRGVTRVLNLGPPFPLIIICQ